MVHGCGARDDHGKLRNNHEPRMTNRPIKIRKRKVLIGYNGHRFPVWGEGFDIRLNFATVTALHSQPRAARPVGGRGDRRSRHLNAQGSPRRNPACTRAWMPPSRRVSKPAWPASWPGFGPSAWSRDRALDFLASWSRDSHQHNSGTPASGGDRGPRGASREMRHRGKYRRLL